MRPRMMIAALAVLAMIDAVAAQPLSRMKGRVGGEGGEAVQADVRIEAVSGPRGDGYVGQRTYTVRSNDKGEWTLIGFKAGAWLFGVAPPDQLLDVVVLPINVLVPAGSGMAGITPAWRPVLKPAPIPPGPAGDWLKQSLAAALEGDASRVSQTLSVVPADADGSALAAAGRICLSGTRARPGENAVHARARGRCVIVSRNARPRIDGHDDQRLQRRRQGVQGGAGADARQGRAGVPDGGDCRLEPYGYFRTLIRRRRCAHACG